MTFNSSKLKVLWLTDTHTKIIGRYSLLNTILDHKPHAVFITGDMSEGFAYLSDLEFLGKKIGRPLYFVRGNHELWGSSFIETNSGIRDLCSKYKNLNWMTDAGVIPLNEETCLIGNDGWYDARVGDDSFIQYTLDWIFIKDFRDLPTMKQRIELMRQIADQSTEDLLLKLEEAVEMYKTIYLFTHIPPVREANRAKGWISDKFYEPYNCNYNLGQKLEDFMSKHKKRHLTILSGHVHQPVTVHMSRNVECRVGKGSYHKISEEEIIYI